MLDPQVVELVAMLEEGEISPFDLMMDLDIMGFDGDIIDYL